MQISIVITLLVIFITFELVRLPPFHDNAQEEEKKCSSLDVLYLAEVEGAHWCLIVGGC